MLGLLSASSFLLGLASAGTVIWDGRFNDYSSSTDLNTWSWANQVGSYQYYIHGTGAVTDYVNLSADYKNPADTTSNQGVKITIDDTAKWNSDMWRTELIPQTTANLGTGTLYYHFSMKRSDTNAPNANFEHQVNFFESHFTEMKYGWINGNTNTNPDNNLRWMVGGVSKWNVDWVADVWHNFAYEIDFSGSTVTLWHSVGSDPLVKTAGPFSASTSTNSADWHLGVLRLPASGSGVTSTAAEDWYYSGVYVESGSINTVIGSGTSSGSTTAVASTSVKSTTTAVPTTTTIPVTTTVSTSATASATGALAAKWAQCGGVGWTGATACVSGSTCTKLNDYYSQCI
ncbi:uncharacterized protein LAJ45_10964 [Morchella importuna]|uniref:CBM1 domain-containing protein n=1 Tax=Morchella conica CCBAS932 TaxID=1392247 RepID=A0A3N4KHI6_9PEZI|nr:uncharacterized protein LAJ45_10964 [Morchella importuna]KAH8145053.1 hypothetical protein LAJ45_10964 [Morchella importuna]RPB10024.1 hypothetical protein P167DRAFT_510006 [Morchella conica CCBAS932]